MSKRSPILGYNHNVRYRGLVFHVQTEDSGILSPHLFTHLFHHGVIVSTRKLVYDSGSAEESIKALMQAQHKAVLKDLKRGQFDDKIDQYLGGTPGLLPRDAAGSELSDADPTDPDRGPQLARASSPSVPAPPGHIVPEPAHSDKLTEAELMLSREPTIDDPVLSSRTHDLVAATPPPLPAGIRTRTADRGSAPSTVRTTLPTDDGPPSPEDFDAGERMEIPRGDFSIDSSPEILIQLELDEPDDDVPARTRSPRDTDVAGELDEHARPTVDVSQLSDGVPGLIGVGPPMTPERRASTAVGAAALPPARPITRPPNRPAVTPPQVISRPLPPSERRSQETDAIEVYAPPPPSAELPVPAGERPGQYSQHKRPSERIPTDLMKDRGRTPGPGVPVPAGLGRPGAPPQRPTPPPPAPSSLPIPRPPNLAPPPIPQPPPRDPHHTAPMRSRTPTPVRITNPATARTVSTSSNNTSGVVMTRPAVIVGAPAKPPPPNTQRVRKAREDEGRGFGQGLISEKSLDEVILAYLSEDADDK